MSQARYEPRLAPGPCRRRQIATAHMSSPKSTPAIAARIKSEPSERCGPVNARIIPIRTANMRPATTASRARWVLSDGRCLGPTGRRSSRLRLMPSLSWWCRMADKPFRPTPNAPSSAYSATPRRPEKHKRSRTMPRQIEDEGGGDHRVDQSYAQAGCPRAAGNDPGVDSHPTSVAFTLRSAVPRETPAPSHGLGSVGQRHRRVAPPRRGTAVQRLVIFGCRPSTAAISGRP